MEVFFIRNTNYCFVETSNHNQKMHIYIGVTDQIKLSEL